MSRLSSDLQCLAEALETFRSAVLSWQEAEGVHSNRSGIRHRIHLEILLFFSPCGVGQVVIQLPKQAASGLRCKWNERGTAPSRKKHFWEASWSASKPTSHGRQEALLKEAEGTVGEKCHILTSAACGC